MPTSDPDYDSGKDEQLHQHLYRFKINAAFKILRISEGAWFPSVFSLTKTLF